MIMANYEQLWIIVDKSSRKFSCHRFEYFASLYTEIINDDSQLLTFAIPTWVKFEIYQEDHKGDQNNMKYITISEINNC